MTADSLSGEAAPCPSCGQPVWPGDNFCEACRAPLTASAARAGPPTPAMAAEPQPSPDAASPTPASKCHYCGSGPISADRYCEACGRKAPSPRDHIETDLGLLAGVTDRGLRHYRNEDAMALAATKAADRVIAIAVVCDGVSGSSRPDEASAAATEAAIGVLVPAARADRDAAAASLQAVQAAQSAVAELAGPAGSMPALDAPSATFVSAVLSPDSVTVCWLGDSRAYWLDATTTSGARQLTTDDSLVAQMVTAGLLSETAALDSERAHEITGWLGADTSDTAPHVTTFAPPGPGVVLICSDGLWNYEPEAARLAERVLPAALGHPLETARKLVDFALQAGGHDNVTVVLAPFPPDEKLLPPDLVPRPKDVHPREKDDE